MAISQRLATLFNSEIKVDDNHKIVVTPEVVIPAKMKEIAVENTEKTNEISEEVKQKESEGSNQIIKKHNMIKSFHFYHKISQ